MLTLEFDMTGVDEHFARMQSEVGAALRPAAQAGAQILYEEVLLNAPRSEKAHSTKGKRFTFQPGNLQRSIYQAFNERESVAGQSASYSISWNKKKAFYGAFVEGGTSRSPAYSFIRKSFDAVGKDAADMVLAVVRERLKVAL